MIVCPQKDPSLPPFTARAAVGPRSQASLSLACWSLIQILRTLECMCSCLHCVFQSYTSLGWSSVWRPVARVRSPNIQWRKDEWMGVSWGDMRSLIEAVRASQGWKWLCVTNPSHSFIPEKKKGIRRRQPSQCCCCPSLGSNLSHLIPNVT